MRTTLIVILVSVLVLSVILGSFCAAQTRTIKNMDLKDFFANLFKIDDGERFLGAHHFLLEHTEHIDFVERLLDAALKKDLDSMRQLFAGNAILEIGDEAMDSMLNAFIEYCCFGTYSISAPIGPIMEETFESGKCNYRILEGPLVLNTDIGEYHIAIKCCVLNEEKPADVGIWSIYIISKEKDNNDDRPYYGDLGYKTGIYFDIARIR